MFGFINQNEFIPIEAKSVHVTVLQKKGIKSYRLRSLSTAVVVPSEMHYG